MKKIPGSSKIIYTCTISFRLKDIECERYVSPFFTSYKTFEPRGIFYHTLKCNRINKYYSVFLLKLGNTSKISVKKFTKQLKIDNARQLPLSSKILPYSN